MMENFSFRGISLRFSGHEGTGKIVKKHVSTTEIIREQHRQWFWEDEILPIIYTLITVVVLVLVVAWAYSSSMKQYSKEDAEFGKGVSANTSTR